MVIGLGTTLIKINYSLWKFIIHTFIPPCQNIWSLYFRVTDPYTNHSTLPYMKRKLAICKPVKIFVDRPVPFAVPVFPATFYNFQQISYNQELDTPDPYHKALSCTQVGHQHERTNWEKKITLWNQHRQRQINGVSEKSHVIMVIIISYLR